MQLILSLNRSRNMRTLMDLYGSQKLTEARPNLARSLLVSRNLTSSHSEEQWLHLSPLSQKTEKESRAK